MIHDSGDRKDGVKITHVGRQWLGQYTGFQTCRGEIIVMLDADGSTDGAALAA